MILSSTLIVASYLCGSLSAAIIVCRILGFPDPRQQGSGNPGTTNVLRVAGKKAAAATLAGDMLKGLLPVLIARAFNVDPSIQALVALAAFLGHLYPLFFGFRGGKGVATALGVLLGLNFYAGLLTIGIWLLIAKLFRISSLSALVSIFLAPGLVYWFNPNAMVLAVMCSITLLLFWRHIGNIKNLLNGTERRINSN